MESLMALFFSLYTLGGIAVVLAGLGGLIFYILRSKQERDSETFEDRKW